MKMHPCQILFWLQCWQFIHVRYWLKLIWPISGWADEKLTNWITNLLQNSPSLYSKGKASLCIQIWLIVQIQLQLQADHMLRHSLSQMHEFAEKNVISLYILIFKTLNSRLFRVFKLSMTFVEHCSVIHDMINKSSQR